MKQLILIFVLVGSLASTYAKGGAGRPGAAHGPSHPERSEGHARGYSGSAGSAGHRRPPGPAMTTEAWYNALASQKRQAAMDAVDTFGFPAGERRSNPAPQVPDDGRLLFGRVCLALALAAGLGLYLGLRRTSQDAG